MTVEELNEIEQTILNKQDSTDSLVLISNDTPYAVSVDDIRRIFRTLKQQTQSRTVAGDVIKKILEIANKSSTISFCKDWGGNSITIQIDDKHTHCGLPEGFFEDLLNDIYNRLVENKGLSWE